MRPAATRMSLPSIGLLARGRAHRRREPACPNALRPGCVCASSTMSMPSPLRMRCISSAMSASSRPISRGTVLDDRHAAAEAPIRLRHFDADIAAAEHDQMRRRVVEIQRLDMRERIAPRQARNIRNRRMRADIDHHLIAAERARAAVVELHLDGLRRDEPSAAHDQLGAARLHTPARETRLRVRPCRACARGPSPYRSATAPVIVPKSAACCARCATRALQISFLLGRHATAGHEPPTHCRSTTATRCPDRARCHASSLPP